MKTFDHALKFGGLLLLLAVLHMIPFGWIGSFAICMAGLWKLAE